MRLEVVGPRYWQPIVADALGRARTGGGIGFAVLRSLHSRQCGVPPEICISFADWIGGYEHGSWLEIHRELAADPELDDDEVRKCPPYELTRLLFAPIMLAAQRQLPINVVFAGPGYPEAVSEPGFDYEDYCRRFIGHAREVAARHASFEDGRAAARGFLSMATRHISRRTLSRIDEMGLDIYFAAGVSLVRREAEADSSVRTLQATSRGGLRPQQDGVTGVRRVHSVEGLSSVVPGQLVGPPALIAHRFIEEGVLVYDRPPPCEDPQHVLLLALVPDACEGPSLSTFRGAWWLFAWQAIDLLTSRGYEHVRVAWVQSVHGEVQAADVDLAGLRVARSLVASDRRRFMAAASSARSRIAPFTRGRVPLAAAPAVPVRNVVSALAHMISNPSGTGTITLGEGEPLDLVDYTTVFAVTVTRLAANGDDDGSPIAAALDVVSPALAEGLVVRIGPGQDGACALSMDGIAGFAIPGADVTAGATAAAESIVGHLLGKCLETVSERVVT